MVVRLSLCTPRFPRRALRVTVGPMIKRKTVMTDPGCACGTAIVGTVKNGIRHGMKRCVAIGSQEAQEAPEPNRRRIADRIDGYDRGDLGESPDY
jgi:hypothetical protein